MRAAQTFRSPTVVPRCQPRCFFGMFNGSQSRQGKSQSPVTWVASVEETKRMKPTDKAIVRVVSESPGHNASEPSGGPEKK
jgi:hypothetical protein